MSLSATAQAVTTEVRPGMQLDLPALEYWFAAHVEGFVGPLAARQFRGGQSNPTYLLETPASNYVLRRKPPGQLLASAHAVDREYRVLAALGAHTDVPVAHTYALCTDEGVIGSWFYVMEHLDGRVYWDPSLPELPRDARRSYYDAMIAALASLHRVDPAAVGLADFGRASGYLERQIARWTKQYVEDTAAGRVPAMDRLIEWLPLHLPTGEQRAAIVHGDFRLDNLIFDATAPRVAGILDWELSTLGDALADFAYHLMVYRMPKLTQPGLAGRDLAALGLPSEREYVERYCALTGRRDIANLDYYTAFCMFRMAAILHGIRGRLLRGTAASAQAQEYARHVEPMADLAWAQAERAGA
jgi:aminoglycoside phosphotransferase (APT) family kinase protein